MRKTKTESFGSQKQDAEFSLCTVIFAMIAKICYSENFAMHSNFRYDSEFSNVEKFWHCSLANVPLLLATSHLIHVFLLSFPFSDILFF